MVDFLKDKLPDSLASQIDSLLSGGGVSHDLQKNLGGLFSFRLSSYD